jgi:tetrahydromethanopterin S-methyltransferase subunit A
MQQINNELLGTLAEELERIYTIPKCEGCKCFADTVQEFRTVASKQIANDLIERIDVLAAQISVTHDCIGCNPCYPVDVSNALNEMGEAESMGSFAIKAGACSETACSCTPSPKQQKRETVKSKWPPEAGEYIVGNPAATVAISTLASEELPKQFKRAIGLKNVAIIGRTCTENIGIEKVVKNIIANPVIRFLILCGQESGAMSLNGHLTGQTFLAAKKNGINAQQRVIGSPGKRPVLKNTGFTEVERFRQQVELIDLIGCETSPHCRGSGELCRTKSLRISHDLPLKGSLLRTVAAVTQEIEMIHAEPLPKLQLDKNGYFIILPQRDRAEI